MIGGIAAAAGACALWGLVYIAPHYTAAFSAFELTAVRYAFFGAMSVGVLLGCGLRSQSRGHVLAGLGPRDWLRFVIFGLTGFLGFYALCALAIQRIGTAFTALIIGSLPLIMAVFGNLLGPVVPFRRLGPPLLLVGAGIALIHADALDAAAAATGDPLATWTGIAAAFGAVAAWTYYGLANAAELARRPATLSSAVWTGLVGVATLAALVPVTLAALVVDGLPAVRPKADVVSFLAWAAVLGIVCSWGATFLWNVASRRLPRPLLAQLIVVETLFALGYGYWHENRAPSAVEAASALLILGGVVWAVRIFSGRVQQPAA